MILNVVKPFSDGVFVGVVAVDDNKNFCVALMGLEIVSNLLNVRFRAFGDGVI
jgi:hypothetical protein